MSRIRITADNKTLMDAHVGVRKGELPSLQDIQKQLQDAAGGTFQPWAICTIQALALTMQPLLAGNEIPNTTLTITTRDNGWAIDVSTD